MNQASINIGLVGPDGRMGKTLTEYLKAITDIKISCTLTKGQHAKEFLSQAPDVVVDLSVGPAIDAHGALIAESGIPYIIGATGFSQATLSELHKLGGAGEGRILLVPNFSLGANLMMLFAETTAKYMEYPVVTERHHPGKADAPSGTAFYTAQRIADAAGDKLKLRASTRRDFSESAESVLGADADNVAIHSVRGEGYLAEQEVRMTLPGEVLTIEHRSIDRQSFMPGIIYAVRYADRINGFMTGLHTIMDL